MGEHLVTPDQSVILDLIRAREDTDSVLELYLRAWVQAAHAPKPFRVEVDQSGQPNRLIDARNGSVVAEFELANQRVRTKWVVSLQALAEIYEAGLDLMRKAGVV